MGVSDSHQLFEDVFVKSPRRTEEGKGGGAGTMAPQPLRNDTSAMEAFMEICVCVIV